MPRKAVQEDEMEKLYVTAKRLEEQLASKRSVDKNRKKLCETLVDIIMRDEPKHVIKERIVYRLFRNVFYGPINTLRRRKDKNLGPQLQEALKLYKYLVNTMEERLMVGTDHEVEMSQGAETKPVEDKAGILRMLYELLLNMGDFYRYGSQREEAVNTYERMLRFCPGGTAAFNQIAVCLQEAGQQFNALYAYARALNCPEPSTLAPQNLPRLLQCLRKGDKWIEQLTFHVGQVLQNKSTDLDLIPEFEEKLAAQQIGEKLLYKIVVVLCHAKEWNLLVRIGTSMAQRIHKTTSLRSVAPLLVLVQAVLVHSDDSHHELWEAVAVLLNDWSDNYAVQRDESVYASLRGFVPFASFCPVLEDGFVSIEEALDEVKTHLQQSQETQQTMGTTQTAGSEQNRRKVETFLAVAQEWLSKEVDLGAGGILRFSDGTYRYDSGMLIEEDEEEEDTVQYEQNEDSQPSPPMVMYETNEGGDEYLVPVAPPQQPSEPDEEAQPVEVPMVPEPAIRPPPGFDKTPFITTNPFVTDTLPIPPLSAIVEEDFFTPSGAHLLDTGLLTSLWMDDLPTKTSNPFAT